MSKESTFNILIIKLSAIGDVVHSLPFLEVMRRKFPHSHIDWLVEEAASQIIEGHPAIRRVIVSRRKSWIKRVRKGTAGLKSVIGELADFSRDVRAQEYDLIVDLQGLLKSGVLVGLSKGKRKIGMSGAREGGALFLNESPVRVDYNQHAIDRSLKVAEYLGGSLPEWSGSVPVFDSDKKRIDLLLKDVGFEKRPLFIINPIARWKTKLWLPERFAGLADRLKQDMDCEIVFTGSKEDRRIIEEISNSMKERPLNLAGRTNLKELAHLYGRSEILITTDTGPMHIAAAMGCPVVALFGPTAPWRTGPYGKGHKIIRADVRCSPCFRKRCGHMACMNEITTEMVFEGVKGMVNANRKPQRKMI